MAGTTTSPYSDLTLEALRGKLAIAATAACNSAERTALDAIEAALVAAGLGKPETADRLRSIGGGLAERAQAMQAEIARCLDLDRDVDVRD